MFKIFCCCLGVLLLLSSVGVANPVTITVDGSDKDSARVEELIRKALEEDPDLANRFRVQRAPAAKRDSAPTYEEDSVDEEIPEAIMVEMAPSLRLRERIFAPLMADPRWPHFSAAYHHYVDDGDLDIASVGLGGWFTTPIYGARDGNATDGVYQFGVQAGVFSIFDLDSESGNLLNTDFLIALPTFTYRQDRFSLLARFYHQSSHLGDEHILYNDVTLDERINLSYEVLDAIVSWDFDIFGDRNARVYGGPGYIIHSDPTTFNRWYAHYGAEFSWPTAFPEKGHFWGMRFRPIAGVDIQQWDETDWDVNLSARGGVSIEEIFGRPARNNYQILVEYYNGQSPNGQFLYDDIEYIGIGVHGYLF